MLIICILTPEICRQDLANIVRRRGYKFIRQLLETSSMENFIGSNIDTGQTGNLEVLGDPGGESWITKIYVFFTIVKIMYF